MKNEYGFNVVALTQGPKHHFFGYFDIQACDSTGNYVLAMESDFDDHFPTADDTSTIGMVEWETKKFHPLTETRAWNPQQGCMLHWLPTEPARKIIYNDRDGDRFVSIILDVFSGEKRMLPKPIAGLTNDGRRALSVNYARLRQCRRTVGYSGLDDPNFHVPHPSDDGLFVLDLETGKYELLCSFEQAFELNPLKDARESTMWFNHPTVNTDDSRVTWVSCYLAKDGPSVGKRAFLVAAMDGTGLQFLTSYGNVSHHDWLDPERILVWSDLDGKGACFNLLNVVTAERVAVARDQILQDGHCAFSGDRRRLVVDTYASNSPDRLQTLFLWDMQKKHLEVMGRFYQPPYAVAEWKCDLHPRWDRDDRWVVFDSTHEGSRQMYAIDTSGPTGRSDLATSWK